MHLSGPIQHNECYTSNVKHPFRYASFKDYHCFFYYGNILNLTKKLKSYKITTWNGSSKLLSESNNFYEKTYTFINYLYLTLSCQMSLFVNVSIWPHSNKCDDCTVGCSHINVPEDFKYSHHDYRRVRDGRSRIGERQGPNMFSCFSAFSSSNG